MKSKIIACLLLIFILTGCMNSTFNYELDILKEEVVSAEIVEVIDDVDNIIEMNTLNLIEVNDLEEILTELSNMQFIWTKGRPQRADGVCLKLNYANDEHEILCDNIVIRLDYKNQEIYHKDIYAPKEFDEFISKYRKE